MAVITRSITNIDEAHELIMDDAKKLTVGLNWKKFKVTNIAELADNTFDTIALLILRQSGMHFQLNVLDERVEAENQIIQMLPQNHRRHFNGSFWIVLLKPSLSADEATLIRDWLFMKMPEAFAVQLKLNGERVVTEFYNNSKEYKEATQRTYIRMYGK